VLVAAVRRVRQPGAKFDEMLIHESAEQGYSKSTLIEALAVTEDWYSDSVPLNADDKKMIENSSGKWICEIGELQGMRKGEVEKIRAQLSRRFGHTCTVSAKSGSGGAMPRIMLTPASGVRCGPAPRLELTTCRSRNKEID
jgi:hypothetical protein